MPANYAPVVYQGDNFLMPMTLVNADPGETPIDITGWTFQGDIKPFLGSPTTLASFTINIVSAVDGELAASLSPAQTVLLPQNCVYDIEATKADLTIETLLFGRITVLQQVT